MEAMEAGKRDGAPDAAMDGGGTPKAAPDAAPYTAMRFAGYAALFDREDRGGDIIRKGAFARAVRRWSGRGRQEGRGLPLLWQHRPDKVIGGIERMAEDDRGLRVTGWVDAGAGEEQALLKAGRINGLSFGYRVVRADGRAPRVLKDLELIEVSLVSSPMQPGARVHAVE